MPKKLSRRTVILRGMQIPVAGSVLFGLGSCGGSGSEGTAACVDLDSLSAGQRNTRESLGYTEASADPDKVCAGCAYFHPGASATACGTCDIFGGHPANPRGHCDSWSAKA